MQQKLYRIISETGKKITWKHHRIISEKLTGKKNTKKRFRKLKKINSY